jgi:hypothetical protein
MLVDDLVADGPQNGAWMRMKVNGGVGFVDPVDSPCDVPYYATNMGAVMHRSGWASKRQAAGVLDNIFDWLGDQRAALRPVLAA